MDKILRHPDTQWTEHVCFSPDSQYLAASCCKFVLLWKCEALNHAATELDHQENGNIWKCAFSPDSLKLYVGCSSGQLFIWTLSTLTVLKKVQAHNDCIFGVTVHPEGGLIATCSADKTINIINAKDGTIISSLKGHQNSVEDVVFSSDGTFLASCSKDRTIQLWSEVTNNKPKNYILKGHTRWVFSCNFSSQGRFLVSASADKKIGIWNVEHKELLQFLYGHTNIIWRAIFVPVMSQGLEDRLVISCSSDRTARLWDIQSGRVIQTYRPAEKPKDGSHQLLSCDYNSHHKVIALGSFNGETYIQHLNTEILTLDKCFET